MASEETKRYLAKYSKKERALNWLAYHKWWLVLGAAAVAAAVWAVAAGMARVVPDYQVAVVGESALPAGAAEALERALAGFGEDLNGDGRVVVQVADYPLAGPEDATLRTVLETRLMADLMAGESCLFLLADPDGFQQRYQALAEPDGGAPAEEDGDGMGKVYRWSDCPALAALDLGSWSETVMGETIGGETAPLVEGLYLGRRYWSESSPPRDRAAYDALWDALTAGASR